MNQDIDQDLLSETENFIIWRSKEESGFIYHIELGGLSLHLASEEWEELVTLFLGADKS